MKTHSYTEVRDYILKQPDDRFVDVNQPSNAAYGHTCVLVHMGLDLGYEFSSTRIRQAGWYKENSPYTEPPNVAKVEYPEQYTFLFNALFTSNSIIAFNYGQLKTYLRNENKA